MQVKNSSGSLNISSENLLYPIELSIKKRRTRDINSVNEPRIDFSPGFRSGENEITIAPVVTPKGIKNNSLSALTIGGVNLVSTSNVVFNGVAKKATGIDGKSPVFRLLQGFGANTAGSLFLQNPITINANTSFSSYFQFQISNPVGGSDVDGRGADGLVFVIQSLGNTALGGGGVDIGYGGLKSSIGVEFDTWNNGNIDRNSGNHVGINLDGNISSVALQPVFTRLNDGQLWNVWVDYDGSTNGLEVRLSLTTSRPSDPIVGQEVDLPALLKSDKAFFGFTSGAWDAGGTHDILNWELNVKDNNNLPVLSINDPSIREGDEGTRILTFGVTRTGIATKPISVNFTTAKGTATAGSDYVAGSGVLNFATNETFKTINVTLIGDRTVEPDETFFVNLSNAVNATINDTQGKGTIVNDDTRNNNPATLTIADLRVTEGDSGTKTAIFNLTRGGNTGGSSSVNFSTVNGTATAGSDYVARSGTLNFAANEATKTISITINGDKTLEPDETFTVNLSNPVNATIIDSQATGTIINDDTVPNSTVTLRVNPSGISEDAVTNFVYTFTRTGSLTNALTVNFKVGGTASFGSDYTRIGSNPFTAANGSVTFAANASTATLTLDPIADTRLENNETIDITLTNGNGYNLGTTSPVVATIIEDDGTRFQRGTAGDDFILGAGKSDVLTGGTGNDTLTGGVGRDIFAYSSPRDGVDKITNFKPKEDFIMISAPSFDPNSLISGGSLTVQQFRIGSAANTPKERFIYNSTTGNLFFDKDGNGSIAPVQLATLSPGLALTNQDFLIS